MKRILLCGVGGQGTVLASRIIASAAMKKGFFARTAETIGMAQRGGSVVSHVSFGDAVASPLIPFGCADLIIGFEPGETVRNLVYLRQGGSVVVCDRAVNPVTAALSGNSYDVGAMLRYLTAHVDDCKIISYDRLLEHCGTPKVVNVALIGAALNSGSLGLDLDCVRSVLAEKIKALYLELNEKALLAGAKIDEVQL